MSVNVIVGAQWGDEGKGKLVDLMSERVDIVARYQGGANAGHTVEIGPKRYVLHLIPSGVFHERVVSVIGNGVVVDPIALLSEMRMLDAAGISLKGRLKISHHAHLIMPYHKILDGLFEQGSQAIGTTGRGIGPAYYDKAARTGVRIVDLLDRSHFRKIVKKNIEEKNRIISRIYEAEELHVDEILDQYTTFDTLIDEYVTDTAYYLNNAIRDGQSILCEGAQGALLDVDHGTYPYVTSSSPTSGGATIGLGIPPTAIDGVIGVMKAYTTRVGLGPFPTELKDELGEYLRSIGNEFGATTGRPRRCGWFDAFAMKYSVMINGITRCGIMKLDVLDGLEEIKICTGYEFRGKQLKYFPTDAQTLSEVTPVYLSLPGWKENTTSFVSYDDFPENAKRYLRTMEELLGIKILCVSVGPKREQTVLISEIPQW